jgi:glycine/D-amino acid oxidase-like deaminating enzyme
MPEQSFDVIIAGGGIVGAACAASCASEGLRIALVERDAIGSGATAAGMGHIVVMDDSEAQFALTRYSQNLWNTLAPRLPASAEYVQRGTVWVAADEEEMAEAVRKQRSYSERGVPAMLLTPYELAAQEPNLRAGLAGGLLVPEDAVVHSPSVAVHLAREAESHGATLILGHSVTRLARGEALLDDGTLLRAPRLVNATGAWSPELDSSIPVRKRKGHLALADAPPGFLHHQVVELGYLKSAHSVDTDSVAFNVQPRLSGQIYIGSSRQYGAENTGVDQHILTAMLERAALFMPALASLPITVARAGFRAATPDKLPLIGPSLGDETVWLATGHEGLGITTSLATAELIAAAFTGRKPPIAPEPYLPSRAVHAQPTH